jgi:hypothetical protein
MAKCKVCKVKFEPKFFLQKACFDPACLAEWAKRERETKVDKKYAKRKKEFNDNDRKIRLPAAQKAFNAFIRKRDAVLPCISCDNFVLVDMPYGKYDCGHFKTVGGFPELRFEELNAHKQCKKCNGGAGNFTRKDASVSKEYRKQLIKKIGLDKVEWLEGAHEPKKYTCAELKEIELLYKQKLKELIQ